MKNNNPDFGLKELTDFLDKHGQTNYVIEGNKVVYKGDLLLSYRSINELPESFGNLKIKGRLDLSGSRLTSLPESFGNLEIESGLHLARNQLTSLPESFSNLKVGGSLYLYNNKLTSLPESFGNLELKGLLSLTHNQLVSLPESFGNLKVGGDIYLHNNKLASLPENFGNLKVGGLLYLSGNKFTILPRSITKLNMNQLIIEEEFENQIENMKEWYSGNSLTDARFALAGREEPLVQRFDYLLLDVYFKLVKDPASGLKEWSRLGKDLIEYCRVMGWDSRIVRRLKIACNRAELADAEELEDLITDLFDELYDFLFT